MDGLSCWDLLCTRFQEAQPVVALPNMLSLLVQVSFLKIIEP